MVVYRTATENDMMQVAKTHELCFPEYFTSLFGTELLAAYYGEFLKEKSLFVVAVDNDDIIGFCMGYDRRNTKAKNNFISYNKKKLVKRMMKLCLSFNGLAIKKCVRFIGNKLKKKKTPLVDAEGDLLSICVLDEYKGKGIAKELVKHFEENLVSNSISDYTLGVYKDNLGAIKFYKKIGMNIVAEDEEEYKFYKEMR